MTVPCLTCGVSFKTSPSRVKAGVVRCSPECRRAAERLAMKPCDVCGAMFSATKPSHVRCSRACRSKAALSNFWNRIDRSDPERDCWPWGGRRDKCGYGRARLVGETLAHRIAYRLTIGPIPDGLELDHVCRNRACINPAHLEPVTKTENMRRGVSPQAICARKTHCVNGHPFTPENTYTEGGRRRQCRVCQRASTSRYQQKRKAVAA